MKLPVGYVPGVGVVKASAYGGYGQRMLEKMGWEKGDGLGKEKHGMKSAIEAKEKKDTSGVGAEKQGWDWRHRFWEDAYNSAAKSINHELEGSSSSSSSASSSSDASAPGSSSASDSDSDEETLTPAGGKVINRDGTFAHATQDELKLAAELAKDPWGRFGGRAGKMARIKLQEEMEAQKARERLGVPSGSSDVPAASKAATEELKEKPRPRGRVVVLKIKEDPNVKREKFKPTPGTGWWGASYFKSAGAMGENSDEDEDEDFSSRKRKSFNEDDQTALYMKVHDNQRQGRRGLGKSDKLKIAGGKWEGSKKSFEEEEEEQPTEKASKKAKRGHAEEPKEEEEEPEEDEEPEEKQAAAGSSAPKIKWMKVVKELLKEAPKRRLKMEKLCKKLMKHQRKHHHQHSHHHHGLEKVKSKDKVHQLVMKKVNSSGKLSVCEKGVVTLKSQ